MKKLFLASVAAIPLVAGPARAADVPAKPVYKAVPPVAAPVLVPYSWTGFYIGGHVGGGWSGTANPLPSPADFGALGLNFSQKGSGVVAGGQIGYNWQLAPTWVIGIEADLSAIHIHTRSVDTALRLSGVPFQGANDCPGVQFCSVFMTRDLDRIGTVRGRVGYAWDRWLAYFTGGFAYGRVSYSGDFLICCQFPVSFTDTKTGSTIGGGLEYALPDSWGNWTIRGEYLFVSLGSASATALQIPAGTCNTAPCAVRYDWNHTDVHIARFALNYKFGWGKGKAPVVAKY
jgi:outer membrane immunogenic protein